MQRAAHIWGLVPCLSLDLERMFAHYYVPDVVLSKNIAALRLLSSVCGRESKSADGLFFRKWRTPHPGGISLFYVPYDIIK